eukprot:20130-Eustigmatos_ZCMA.PRE.1
MQPMCGCDGKSGPAPRASQSDRLNKPLRCVVRSHILERVYGKHGRRLCQRGRRMPRDPPSEVPRARLTEHGSWWTITVHE